MYKILNISFLALILSFCISFFRGGSAEDMFTIEKRELRSLPSLSEYTISELPDAYNGYVSDHFPLRRTIMKLAAETSYKLFGSIRSDTVVIGKNDFLFLNTMGHTSPRADYQGTNLYSDEELSVIVSRAEDMLRCADNRNRKIIFMIVPNKEEVYSHYLPESFIRLNDLTRRQQLCNRLENTGLTVIDTTEPLKQYAESEDDIYFRADTHWTGKGAYIAASMLLDELGVQHVSYAENSFIPGKYYESDIANLCNLYDMYSDNFDVEAVKDICASPVDKKVVFMGDSFSWRIEEYIGESFTQGIVYEHITPQEKIMQENAEVLVIEVIERNLADIESLFRKYTF